MMLRIFTASRQLSAGLASSSSQSYFRMPTLLALNKDESLCRVRYIDAYHLSCMLESSGFVLLLSHRRRLRHASMPFTCHRAAMAWGVSLRTDFNMTSPPEAPVLTEIPEIYTPSVLSITRATPRPETSRRQRCKFRRSGSAISTDPSHWIGAPGPV